MKKTERSVTKRISAVLVAGAMLLTLPLAGCNQNQNGDNSSQTTQTEKDTKFGNGVVVKSDHFTISKPIAEYLLNYLYQSFCSRYGTYYFDTTQSLKTQYYDEEKKQTWFDYFVDYTKSYIEQTLVFAEAATASGMTLSEDDLKNLESGFDAMSSVAAESSLTVDEYIKQNYGPEVTKEDIENIQKITMLAQKYSDELYSSFNYTESDYEKYYKDNQKSFDMVDYMTYTFSYSDTNEEGSFIIDSSKQSVMKENANALANSKTPEEFEDYIRQYLKANPNLVKVTAESSESSITEEDFNNAIESTVAAANKQMNHWSEATDADKWIFDTERKVGDTTVIENQGSYSVYLITKTLYRDETINKNVRHILIKSGDERTDEEAKEKAETIYEDWKKGEATEDTFASFAMDYSEDTGSASKGGLYENVIEGRMVKEFNDWIFDPSRKPGDTDIIKTSYGYHIMYFSGNTDPVWKMTADKAMREQDVKKKYEEYQTLYTVEFDDETFKSFDIKITSDQ